MRQYIQHKWLKALKKTLCAAPLGALVLIALLTTPSNSNADNKLSSSGIQAHAYFVSAAYIMVEHQPFIAPIGQNTANDFFQTISRLQHALISIKGMPGETVVFNCDIASYKKKDQFIYKEHNTRRSCNGTGSDQAKELLVGNTYTNGIYLDDAAIDWENSNQDRHVSIEIAYI